KGRPSRRSSGRPSIFPIGPRRRGRASQPTWRRTLLRLAGAPLWLLLGVLLGAVAVGFSQGWFAPAKPRPVASAPSSKAAPPVPAVIPAPVATPITPPTAAIAPPPTPAPPVYEESSSAPAVFDSNAADARKAAPVPAPAAKAAPATSTPVIAAIPSVAG